MAREPRRGAAPRGRTHGGRMGGVKKQETLGANKIKSLLRQTKRLLSKESLPPGVRIEAERKYKALEHELEVRTQSNKERAMAARYHKVKFFGTLPVLTQNDKNLYVASVSASGRSPALSVPSPCARSCSSRALCSTMCWYVHVLTAAFPRAPAVCGPLCRSRAQGPCGAGRTGK